MHRIMVQIILPSKKALTTTINQTLIKSHKVDKDGKEIMEGTKTTSSIKIISKTSTKIKESLMERRNIKNLYNA